MNDKTILVTGANSGIGKATAAMLAHPDVRVVLTARSEAKLAHTLDELRDRELGPFDGLILDLGSLASVRACAEQFMARHGRLDVLINNAGVFLDERQETTEGLEATFGVNHVGPFLLTKLLLPALQNADSARIVNLSSDAHRRALRGIDFDDLQRTRRYNGLRVYAESKLANILFTRELATRLRPEGITSNAVHPGVVATGFAQDGDAKGVVSLFYRWAAPLMRTPEQGAKTSVHVASAPRLEGVTGRYFRNCKPVEPSRRARDDAAARRLWEITESLIDHHSPTPRDEPDWPPLAR